MRFLWDTKHLWILLTLLVVGGAGAIAARSRMIPATYGDLSGRYGPYRAAALGQISARPSILVADSVCQQCHQEIGEEREGTMHEAVLCMHCHGVGREHVEQARAAAKTGGTVPPAKKWDGDFLTKIDLFVTKNRATCLACHEAVVGMPDWFQKINVAEHLEDNGSEDPESKEACWQCHGAHNTEYRELEE